MNASELTPGTVIDVRGFRHTVARVESHRSMFVNVYVEGTPIPYLYTGDADVTVLDLSEEDYALVNEAQWNADPSIPDSEKFYTETMWDRREEAY